jgi:hypothetical protein
MSNPVINAAMTRAAMIGLLLGVLAFIGARQQGIDWEQAIYGGVGAFVASVLSRGFGEGLYDSNRAANNNVNAGDVPMAAPDVVVTEPAKP